MATYIILSILIVMMIIIILRLPENFEGSLRKNGINSFDCYMYINLNHRKDRKNQITNELNKMKIPNIKTTRIDAVHEKYNGHIGCAKSHIRALQLAKEKNYKNVIIFEDDFMFTENKKVVDQKINKFLDYFSGDWDIIQLTAHYNSLKDIDSLDDIKKVNRASTSSAYIIQRHFYDKLINNITEAKEKMEEEMIIFHRKNKNKKKKKFTTNHALDQHWNSLQNKSKWYIFNPFIGKQASSSSIMSTNLEGFSDYGTVTKFHRLSV